jgi:hypothetical protein
MAVVWGIPPRMRETAVGSRYLGRRVEIRSAVEGASSEGLRRQVLPAERAPRSGPRRRVIGTVFECAAQMREGGKGRRIQGEGGSSEQKHSQFRDPHEHLGGLCRKTEKIRKLRKTRHRLTIPSRNNQHRSLRFLPNRRFRSLPHQHRVNLLRFRPFVKVGKDEVDFVLERFEFSGDGFVRGTVEVGLEGGAEGGGVFLLQWVRGGKAEGVREEGRDGRRNKDERRGDRVHGSGPSSRREGESYRSGR